MPDGDRIIIGQANTASNPGNETRLSRNELTDATVFVARNLNAGGGIQGESSSGSPGVQGVSIGGVGVSGSTITNFGVFGFSTMGGGVGGSARNVGVAGDSKDGIGVTGSSISGMGVWGGSNTSYDVYGGSIDSDGVTGWSNNGNGVRGSSGTAAGVYGESLDSYGVFGQSFAPRSAAVYGDSSRSIGVYGSSGSRFGVGGVSRGAAGVNGSSYTFFGGEFVGPPSNNGSSGSLRLFGNVVKFNGEYSEALPHPDGSQRLMYAPLSPESWYEDFGRAELVEGRGRVEFDPDFAAILSIDDGDYHVFLTPEGDSNGLYVSSRGPTAFEVHEQRGGTSSLTFSYRVVVTNKRKDAQAERLAKVEEPQSMPEPSPEPRPQPGSPAAARGIDFVRLEEERRRQIDELRRQEEKHRRQMEELHRRMEEREGEVPPEST